MATRRRTTLAAVSSASLNSRVAGSSSSSRASMAPTKQKSMISASTKPLRVSIAGGGRSTLGASRPSMSGRPSMGTQRQSMGRPSMAATDRKSSTGMRRSSAYGNSAGGSRSDPRPLMDKSYLNESMHKMADYLSTHGYDQPINMKTLSRPSGRDFNNIMGFLFRQIDPNYVPSGRFEDDVIPFLKMIRYPFQISRSSLAAVGAPQTWPKVMGAISWIVDYLMYEEVATAAEEDQRSRRQQATEEERDRDEEDGLADQGALYKEFIQFLGEAYSYFLDGDDDAYTALTTDFFNTHEADNARAEERTKQLDQSNERLAQQIQELEESGNSLPKLEEGLRLAMSDRDKYLSLLEQLNIYKQNLQNKIDTRLDEENRLKEALVTVQDASVVLRQQISRQEFSAEDVERYTAERKRVKEAMHSARDAKAKARKEGWTAQAEVSKNKDVLKESLQQYENKAKALLLIPSGTTAAKNAGDISYEVRLDEGKLDSEEGILTNDIRGVIRPALAELKGAVMRRTQGLRQELSNLLVVEDKVEEEITDVESELEVLHKQVKRREDMYNKEKYSLDQRVAASRRGVEDEERRLAGLGASEDLDRLTAEHNASVDVLRVEIEALKERQEMELRQAENILHSALETALDYKEREEKCLAGLKERYRQHHAEIMHGETPLDAVLAEGEDDADGASEEETNGGGGN